jgi:uncharacterized protein (TIGR03435 family)
MLPTPARATFVALVALAAVLALPQRMAKFEVASIKPSSSAEIDAIKRSGRSSLFPEQGFSISGNRVTILGLTTITLIRAAFSLRADQFSGAPSWTATEPYDIAAQADAGIALSFPQVREMLQTLLADRFQLRFHRETKEGTAYALVADKSGPKLKASAASEYSTHVTAGKNQVQMTIFKATVAQLCARLSPFVGRPVTDQTGLTGVFDMKLEFAPEGLDGASDFPSIFTALQEQLGLKLESTKAPVEGFVIDRIEHPSSN